MTPHVLVLQHEACEGPGRIAAALAKHGIATQVVRIDRGDAVPARLGDARGLVVMGGPMGVYEADERPHLRDELALIARACADGAPVLGVCLGSQLLAAALGADVRRSGQMELGWLPVTLDEGAHLDPVLGAAPRTFRALCWHGDIFDLPPGATHLASSAMTAHQAFRAGRAWGLLFHLEADAAQVAAMADGFAGDLARAGVDPAALIAESEAIAAEVGPIAESVFARWAALVGG